MSEAEDWARLIVPIIVKVKNVIEECWPGIESYPTDIDLYSLATKIKVKKDFTERQRRAERPKIPPLISSAKKFLRELEKARALTLDGVPSDELEHYTQDLRRIDEANEAVSNLIKSYALRPHNHAAEIEHSLMTAWRMAGVDVPKGIKPGEPLCRAVTGLMKEAGLLRAEDSVSEMLRGRAHRLRSGTPSKGGGRKIAKKVPSRQEI
jgi:hypothetical protein